MVLNKNRKRFEEFSIKIGILFSNFRISPNTWTFISLIFVLAAAYFLLQQNFLAAAALFIISSFLDMVDGSVARVTGKATKFGAYLDTVVDRYVEGIIGFGLLFAGLPGFFIPAYAWIFILLFGSLMTTYYKAAAKEKELVRDHELKGGILERAERLIILFAGMLLAIIQPIYLTYVIVALALLANITALQRVVIASRIKQGVSDF